MHVDHALASRIEAVMALQNARWCRAAAMLQPSQGFSTLAIAGGHAVFSGPLFPTTKATGIGIASPITEPDLDALEHFFQSRGVKPRLEVCPLAPEPLLRLLRARGYRPDAFVSTHVREVFPSDDDPSAPRGTSSKSGLEVAVVSPSDPDLFADTVSRGFSDGAPPDPAFLDMPRASALTPGVTCFLARIDGRPAGAGSMAVTSPNPAIPGHARPLAALFGATTLPPFRRRGVQSALLSERLARAAAAGCDLAVVHSRPGTPSERNIARAGFHLAYTKLLMSLG